MRITANIEARALYKRLFDLDQQSIAVVHMVVSRNTRAMRDEVDRLVSTPVGSANRKSTGRSRKGQPPRSDSGKLRSSIRSKVIRPNPRRPVGTGYVTVDAEDKRGNRYPFMLESGTKHAGKRPFIKKAQRKIRPVFRRELFEAVRRVLKR